MKLGQKEHKELINNIQKEFMNVPDCYYEDKSFYAGMLVAATLLYNYKSPVEINGIAISFINSCSDLLDKINIKIH